jgi:hypothetical protein
MNHLVEIAALLSTWESTSRGGDEFLRSYDIISKMIFPFIKLFQKNRQFLIELLIFSFCNYFRGWFVRIGTSLEYPLKVVADIDSLFCDADEGLYRHVQNLVVPRSDNGIATTSVGCFVYDYMCSSLLTEVLPTAAWIHLLDLVSISVKNMKPRNDEKLFLKFFIQFLIFRKSIIFTMNHRQQLVDILTSQDITISSADVELIFKRASCMRPQSTAPFVYISESSNIYPPPVP